MIVIYFQIKPFIIIEMLLSLNSAKARYELIIAIITPLPKTIKNVLKGNKNVNGNSRKTKNYNVNVEAVVIPIIVPINPAATIKARASYI